MHGRGAFVLAFLQTTGEGATDDDKEKARRWIHDSSVLAGILRRSTHRNPLGRNITKRALKRDNTDGVYALKKLYEKYSPEAQPAATQIQFDAYAQRGCPLDEFIATFDDYTTALGAGANTTEKQGVSARHRAGQEAREGGAGLTCGGA